MKFTEQEWKRVEDLKEIDDLILTYNWCKSKKDWLQEFFWQKVYEWFPDIEDMDVLLEVFPDTEDLIVLEVLEDEVEVLQS